MWHTVGNSTVMSLKRVQYTFVISTFPPPPPNPSPGGDQI